MQDVNCFSSDGRLIQLEYASEAIKLGSIILGIKTKYCALLVLEKRRDDILNENTIGQKMLKFNDSVCCVVSGLTSDARSLIDKIQTKFENSFFVTNENSSIEKYGRVILNLSSFINDDDTQKFFKNRPLGIAFLICGMDQDGFSLLQVDPTGILKKKNFASLGSGQDESIFIIKEGYRLNMLPEEASNLGKKTIRLLTEKNLGLDQHEIFLFGEK